MARSKTKDVVNDPWDMGPSQKTSTIDDMTAMRKQLSETPDITYMNRRETNNCMLSNRSRKRIRDDRSEHDKRMDRQNSRKRNMLDNSIPYSRLELQSICLDDPLMASISPITPR